MRKVYEISNSEFIQCMNKKQVLKAFKKAEEKTLGSFLSRLYGTTKKVDYETVRSAFYVLNDIRKSLKSA